MIKLHDDIHKLPLSVFIDCICDQRLEELIIDGEPSQADLIECWTNLWYQYVDLNKDSESLYILSLKKEVALLKHRITLIESIVFLLRTIYKRELVDALKELSISTEKLHPDNPDYHKRLEQIYHSLASSRLRLQERSAELESFEINRDGETISREYFDRMLMRLSKFQGYHIRDTELMVSKFVALVRDYLSFLDSKQRREADGQAR